MKLLPLFIMSIYAGMAESSDLIRAIDEMRKVVWTSIMFVSE